MMLFSMILGRCFRTEERHAASSRLRQHWGRDISMARIEVHRQHLKTPDGTNDHQGWFSCLLIVLRLCEKRSVDFLIMVQRPDCNPPLWEDLQVLFQISSNSFVNISRYLGGYLLQSLSPEPLCLDISGWRGKWCPSSHLPSLNTFPPEGLAGAQKNSSSIPS